ncbi:DUF6527 family protein [Bradyrhizobium cajani]|uniref:Uncharacterized protein n=1 Tax=Bradyrhizobium cajani TaxID=1928661 RepID=A0A844TEW3_9BRAD|nr:DUF6527 family protein [Bradyrhizobium cajani]MCP3368646.1 DUF6527 family protein [Bradyrhizobium cajani]MVT73561.1 hypothetical protein [Bradyrhizobium cajani]
MNFSIKVRVPSRAEASAHLKQPGEAVIVDRKGPRWLIMLCPCGCGSELPVNLDRRTGPAWRLYESPKGASVYPSVWRDTDCKSHFIILRNKILLFGPRGDDWWLDEEELGESELRDRVLETLSAREQSIEEISDRIAGSVPWDVLRCCRKLCRNGKAIEGSDLSKGRFRRR